MFAIARTHPGFVLAKCPESRRDQSGARLEVRGRMARRPRLLLPGAVYHVFCRGNRKSAIFEDDFDRALFMQTVGEVALRYDVSFYAVCEMTTHYHAVMETPRGNLSAAMRQLNGVYAQSTNRRHGRTGHLFEGRFRSIIVQRESYLRRVVRYVALNPVRSGKVATPDQWQWSTYRASAGFAPCPVWLTTDWMPWAFRVPTTEEARRKFCDYVNTPTVSKSRINWHSVGTGSPEFEAALVEAARARRLDRLLPRRTRLTARPTLSLLFAEVDSVPARDRVVVQAHKDYGYSLVEISRYLGFHPAMASGVLRRLGKRGASP